MENRVLNARSSLSLALILCLSLAALPAYGQEPNGRNRLIGTWDVTVTRESAPPGQPLSFPALFSFLPGGVTLETGSASLWYRSPGHGVWDRTRGREYIATFMFFRFSPDGQYLGTQLGTLTIELAAGDDEFVGTSVFEIRGPDGTLVATGNAAVEGRRMEGPPQ